MNRKLSLFPSGTAIDPEGQLTLRGYRASALADQYGTPLYIYDIDTIRQNILTYQESLSRYQGQWRLTYASKAFLCPALARLMSQAGVGLDVASAGEIFIARAGGAAPADMHLHGNNKSRLDLTAALDAGVGRIVIDHAAELEVLASLAEAQQKPVKVWLRLTPDIRVETHHQYTVTGTADSKFGLPQAEFEAIAGRILSGAMPFMQLTGLHVHLGSHFHDAQPVVAAIEKLLDTAVWLREQHQWRLQELCPGGGWGVRYHPADPPMPIAPFIDDIVTAVQAGCVRRQLPRPRLILEPGRSLVAQAGVALYRVGVRKAIPGVRTYVGVDGGLADNPRPALYQASYTALLANKAAAPDVEQVSIAGPYCESGDILIREVDLPLAEAGDLLAVPVAGAYQLSMSSNYNAALRPAVLFIDNGQVKLVQRRETFEDLIRRDEPIA